MRLGCWTPVLLAAGFGAAAAHADDLSDQIDAAAQAYRRHDLTAAGTALDAASTLLRQKRAELLTHLLPETPPGWTAGAPELATAGPALFGGGVSVSRRYARGADSVEVSVITDSPLMQGVGAFLGAAIALGGDSRLLVIGGRTVSYAKSDNSLQAMIANRTLVKVTGSAGVDEATLETYFRAIRLDELDKREK